MARVALFVAGIVCGAALTAAFAAFRLVSEADDAAPIAESADDARATRPPAAPETPARRERAHRADPIAGIDAGAIEAPPPGDGRITGRVLDGEGHGLRGVAVSVEPEGGPAAVVEEPTADSDERLRRDVRDVVRAHRWRRIWSRSATTDERGEFQVAGLADHAWFVRAELAGWSIRRDDGRGSREPLRDGSSVSFSAHRRFDVPVTVVRADGADGAGASVWRTFDCGSAMRSDWTAARPFVQLGPGQWKLVAKSGADDELRSDEVTVDVSETQAPPEIRLALAERPGAIVAVGAAGDDAPFDVEVTLAGADGVDGSERVAPGGRAAFLDLTPGPRTLTVRTALGAEIHRETFDVGAGVVRREVALPAIGLRDWIDVQVLSPSGAPVAVAEFASGFVSPSGAASGPVRARALGDGRWRVPAYPAGSVGRDDESDENADCATATRRWIAVKSGDAGSTWADVDFSSRADTVLRLERPARLTVRLQGFDASAPELAVCVTPGAGTESLVPALRRDLSCRRRARSEEVTLEGLPARPVHVEVFLEYARKDGLLASADVSLAAGENAVTLVVPQFQELRVALPEGMDPGGVWLQRILPGDWPWVDPAERAPNTVRWSQLAPGSYRLWCPDGDMPITVPCHADVRLQPRRFAAVRFAPAADSPMYAAGLRPGDVCVSLDGAAFEGVYQIDAVFAAARLKERTSLAIVRAGARVDVDVDLSKLRLRWDYVSR